MFRCFEYITSLINISYKVYSEMNSINILKNIENTYPVEKILFNGISIWPVIRVPLVNTILEKKNLHIGNKTVKLDNKTIILLVKNIFYGFKYLLKLRNYEIWAFSNSERRKKHGNIYYDRVIDGVSANFDNTLVIENPIPNGHIARNKLAYREVISDAILNLFVFLIYTISSFFNSFKLENEEILNNILATYDHSFNSRKIIKRFYGQVIVCKLLVMIKRPKIVFMAYPSSYFGYIYTFKKENIPVIELQHGIINQNHPTYNYFKKIQIHLLPDYLFVYGPIFLKYFNKKNYFIDKSKVVPIGYFFMDLIINSKEEDHRVKELARTYSLSIAFSSISLQEIEIEFLKEIAHINAKVLILIIPRKENDRFPRELPTNLKIYRTKNIYNVIKSCDIHSTIVSTTAIEAAYLEKPTIFYNYKNIAYEYYKDLLDKNIAFYARSVEDFNMYLYSFKKEWKLRKNISSNLFSRNYSYNFKNAISKISEYS
jgi:hypothetical protein